MYLHRGSLVFMYDTRLSLHDFQVYIQCFNLVPTLWSLLHWILTIYLQQKQHQLLCCSTCTHICTEQWNKKLFMFTYDIMSWITRLLPVSETPRREWLPGVSDSPASDSPAWVTPRVWVTSRCEWLPGVSDSPVSWWIWYYCIPILNSLVNIVPLYTIHWRILYRGTKFV